jgi:hypothetical protein
MPSTFEKDVLWAKAVILTQKSGGHPTQSTSRLRRATRELQKRMKAKYSSRKWQTMGDQSDSA